MKIITFLYMFSLSVYCLSKIIANDFLQHATFEKYNSERDKAAIEKIVTRFKDCLLQPDMTVHDNIDYLDKSSGLVVLRVQDTTIGFSNNIILKYHFLGYFPCFFGVINGIGIDEEYQRHGYGKKLLEYSIKELTKKNVSKIVLNVRKDNTAARKLYESMGFEKNKQDDKDIVYQIAVGNFLQRNPEIRYIASGAATLGLGMVLAHIIAARQNAL